MINLQDHELTKHSLAQLADHRVDCCKLHTGLNPVEQLGLKPHSEV